jgi:hypothetical protein
MTSVMKRALVPVQVVVVVGLEAEEEGAEEEGVKKTSMIL